MKVFAEAPASSANVGPGFDIFGLSLSSLKEDRADIELDRKYFEVKVDTLIMSLISLKTI